MLRGGEGVFLGLRRDGYQWLRKDPLVFVLGEPPPGPLPLLPIGSAFPLAKQAPPFLCKAMRARDLYTMRARDLYSICEHACA